MSEVIRGGAQAQTEATSETPKFTPGPWEVNIGDPASYLESGDSVYELSSGVELTVAVLPRDVDELDNDYNAHLIASAPDLYQSVLDLLEVVDMSHPSAPAFVDEARAALRKAEGGE